MRNAVSIVCNFQATVQQGGRYPGSSQTTTKKYSFAGSGALADGILQSGDVLISATVNGKTTVITRQYHIIDMMLDMRVNDVIVLNLLRDGEQISVSVTVSEQCLTAY